MYKRQNRKNAEGEMSRILDGIRVIDFTQGHTGSYGTMLLADFGAEIIKIEDHKTGGDVYKRQSTRRWRMR